MDRAHDNKLSYLLQDCSAAIENALLADEQNVLIVLVDLGQGRDQIADVGADTEVGELAGVDGDVVGHGGRRRARECPAPGLLYANA